MWLSVCGSVCVCGCLQHGCSTLPLIHKVVCSLAVLLNEHSTVLLNECTPVLQNVAGSSAVLLNALPSEFRQAWLPPCI